MKSDLLIVLFTWSGYKFEPNGFVYSKDENKADSGKYYLIYCLETPQNEVEHEWRFDLFKADHGSYSTLVNELQFSLRLLYDETTEECRLKIKSFL